MEKAEEIKRQIAANRNQMSPLLPAVTPEQKKLVRVLRKVERELFKELGLEESPMRLAEKSLKLRELIRNVGIEIMNNEVKYHTVAGTPINSADIYQQLHYLTVKAKDVTKEFLKAQKNLEALEKKRATLFEKKQKSQEA